MKGEIIELEFCVGEAEASVQGLADTLAALRTLAVDIGTAISNAFAPLQKSLQSVISSILGMTAALTNATVTLAYFTEVFLQAQAAEQWAQRITDTFNTVSSVIGTIAGVAGALLAAQVSVPVVALVSGIMAAIALITAAIMSVVEHWDGISQAFTTFFTETIPQLWTQFLEWIKGVISAVSEFLVKAAAAIGEFCTSCWDAIIAVWGIVSSWFNDNVVVPVVTFFSGLWDSITAFATAAWTAIKDTFQVVGTWFYQNVIAPVAGFFSGLWEGFLQAASNAWEGVKNVFSAVAGFFGDIFSTAWEKVVSVFSAAGDIFVNIKDAIVEVFKTVVNGIIKGLNSVIAVPFDGINAALNLVKNIEVAGLRPFGGVKTISVPQIPLLAQGAVLPANQPFLAVVGDQKHGTNIEAPLATIEEAVANVMQGQTAAILSGFEASVGVQREILEAVLGIQIGDDVIGSAVNRYTQRQSVIRGGAI